MKDAHGHGSESQGATHQNGVHQIGRALGNKIVQFAHDEHAGGDPHAAAHQTAQQIMTSHIGEHMLFNPDVVAHFSHLLG